jgi:hypothetical protein
MDDFCATPLPELRAHILSPDLKGGEDKAVRDVVSQNGRKFVQVA